jgi:uncharacterized protein (DUF1501 family)
MTTQMIRGIENRGALSRRDLLRYSLAGAGIVALGPLAKHLPTARGTPLTQKRLVVVNCYGGNDTTNMFVPVNLNNYYTRRAGLALQANQCLSLAGANTWNTSNYMFHPSFVNLAARWQAGQVAAVNRVGYPTADLSHFVSQDIFSLGVRGSFGPLHIPDSGWIARFCDKYARSPLGAVCVNVGRPLDIVGGETAPLPVSSLSAFKLQGAGANGNTYSPAYYHRLANAKALIDNFDGTGRAASGRTALQQAHDLTTQVQTSLSNYSSTVTYPTDRFGKQMKDIAVLIQGGFESKIFYTGLGGFDTHSAQLTGQANLFTSMDNAFGAFAADMEAMGVWNDMIVVVITEFGRRNYVNGSSGTDHGHGHTMILLGGAVRGGVRGPELTEADLNTEYLSYAVDFRSIYKEALEHHLGVDPAPVFPEALQINQTLGFV